MCRWFCLLPCEIMDKLSIDGGKFRVNHIYLNINSIEHIITNNIWIRDMSEKTKDSQRLTKHFDASWCVLGIMPELWHCFVYLSLARIKMCFPDDANAIVYCGPILGEPQAQFAARFKAWWWFEDTWWSGVWGVWSLESDPGLGDWNNSAPEDGGCEVWKGGAGKDLGETNGLQSKLSLASWDTLEVNEWIKH